MLKCSSWRPCTSSTVGCTSLTDLLFLHFSLWWILSPNRDNSDSRGVLSVFVVTLIKRPFTLIKQPSPSFHYCLLMPFCSLSFIQQYADFGISLTVFLLLPFCGSFSITIFSMQWTVRFLFFTLLKVIFFFKYLLQIHTWIVIWWDF